MSTVQPYRRPIFNSAVIAEQERVCFELRLRGMSIRAIAAYVAEHHGWPLSKSTVAIRIEAAGKDVTSEQREQVRGLELERLDRLTAVVIETMDSAYARNIDGDLIMVAGPDGRAHPVRDPSIVYAGVDRLLKISERRAKYVGGLEQTGPVEVVVHDAQTQAERLEIEEMVREAKAYAAAMKAKAEAGADTSDGEGLS